MTAATTTRESTKKTSPIQKCQMTARCIGGDRRGGEARGVKSAGGLGSRLPADGLGDPLLQGIGNRLRALPSDHDPQLGLEVEGFVARRAVVEVMLDGVSSCGRQLTIEVAIQLVE